MEGTLLASGLGFPEGPVIMPDGSIVFCDGNTGELLKWQGGELSTFANTGGSPWGAILGTDGAVYVTQGGDVPGSGETGFTPGIQRVNPDGSVELLSSEIAGHTLAGPNDLAFGTDGRLWFTDSGTEQDVRVEVPATGKLFVLDSAGGGEMLMERPEVYPNGIAFDARRIAVLDRVGRASRVPAAGRPGRDLCAAERRPRAGRHGVRAGRPALHLHHHLGWRHGAVARAARCWRRSRWTSTAPTASSTDPRCT